MRVCSALEEGAGQGGRRGGARELRREESESFGSAGEARSRQSGFVTGAPGACCADQGPITAGFCRCGFGGSCVRDRLPREPGSWYQQQRDSGAPAAGTTDLAEPGGSGPRQHAGIRGGQFPRSPGDAVDGVALQEGAHLSTRAVLATGKIPAFFISPVMFPSVAAVRL